GVGALYGSFGGRRRHDKARQCGSPGQRCADRVLADFARDRGRDPSRLPRAWHRHHCLWRSVARVDQRALVEDARGGARLSQQRASLPRRKSRCESCAGGKAASVAQVAIAWVAKQGKDIVPLVGARRRDRLTEALGALDVKLSPDDLAALARAVPPDAASGERYPAAALVHLDSEKRKRA